MSSSNLWELQEGDLLHGVNEARRSRDEEEETFLVDTCSS